MKTKIQTLKITESSSCPPAEDPNPEPQALGGTGVLQTLAYPASAPSPSTTCVTCPGSCCAQVVRLKKAARSTHTGRLPLALTSLPAGLFQMTSPRSAAPALRAPRRTPTRPGMCTRGRSRSERRQPSPHGKAARPGDPGQPPKGPLECTVHGAMTGTWLPVGRRLPAVCSLGTAALLNWNVRHAGAHTGPWIREEAQAG